MAGFSVPQFQFTFEGTIASNGSVNVYRTGTTTPVDLFSDATLTQPVSNPFTLDENGECSFYVGSTVNLRFDAYTSNNTFIESIDPVYVIPDLTSLNTVAALTAGGYINKFRNSAFDVAQRGISGSTSSATGVYSLDGWIVGSDGSHTIAWAQSYGKLGNNSANLLRLTGVANVTDSFIKQRIESTVAAPLCNNLVTVQFLIGNSTASVLTPALTVQHASAQDNWGAPVTDVSAVPLQTIPIGGFGVVAYTFAAVSVAGISTGLEITLDFGAALNSGTNIIYIGCADIRATSTIAAAGQNNSPPTPELRPLPLELVFCQRYYNSTFGNGNAPIQNFGLPGSIVSQTYGATAGELFTYWQFPVQMRAAPTIVTYNPAAANANWRNITGASDIVVLVDPGAAKGPTGVHIGSQTTALTINQVASIHATAAAEL